MPTIPIFNNGYPALTIANYFIEKNKSDPGECPLDQLKLMKLIYFAHGYFLAFKEKRLIMEPVVAWKFGPVIETVYEKFKTFGNKNIKLFPTSDRELDGWYDCSWIKEEHKVTLDEIWEKMKSISGIQLSNWTHRPESPWTKIWNDGGKFSRNAEIPEGNIKEYFASGHF
jgi:uncharacterized phage-associated protein